MGLDPDRNRNQAEYIFELEERIEALKKAVKAIKNAMKTN